MLSKGSVLEDRYRIEGKTGEGGSGAVYQAVQIRTGRRLAVKEIQKSRGENQVRKTLLLLKDLHHPGLPLVLDVLETEQSLLIVMEYIFGNTLQQEMEGRKAAGKGFEPEEILSLGSELCRILLYLHSLSEPLLYRDMKPSNIILSQNGRVVLVDLGSICLCRDTRRQRYTSIGTAGYAAPEQYRKDAKLTLGADIYSLGAVLHHAITGISPAQHPFFFEKITKAAPFLVTGSKGRKYRRLLGLERILEKCTCFRTEDRYEDMEEVLEDLQKPEKCYWAATGLGKVAGALPLVLSLLALCSGLVFFHSEKTIGRLKQEGKAYCLMKAERAEEEQMDSWIQAALDFSPGDGACFAVMLDRMLLDGIFSREEQTRIRELLNQPVKGEGADQEMLLRRNPEACLRFSYQMGSACLYGAEGIPDYSVAEGFFKDVLRAGENWKPEQEGLQAEKELLMRRAEILERICGYRGQQLLKQVQGDRLVSIEEYWKDLTLLLEEDIPAGNILITELGLWREILGLLTDWPSELRNAGISWEEQEEATTIVERLVTGLQDSREAEKYPVIREQLSVLAETVKTVERKRLLLEEAEGLEHE